MTEIGTEQISSICTTQHPATIMTGIIVRLLREHFSDAGNLEFNGTNEFANAEKTEATKQLEKYIWTADNTTNGIQIQPVWLYNTEDIQRRPALYVKRGEWKPEKIAINSGMTVGSRKGTDGNPLSVRGEYHTTLVTGSHSIFSVARTGDEAELLGQEVFEFFLQLAPLLRQELGLLKLEVVGCGEVVKLEEFTNHFAVPVSIGYAFARAWRLEKVAPWLKAITVEVCAT
jgi:hypothetical protein